MIIWNLIAYMSMVLTLHIQAKNDAGGQWIGTCSAVYVSPDTALTAAHCFNSNFTGRAWAKDNTGKSYTVEPLIKNTQRDLVLVRVKGPKHTFVRIGRAPTMGDNVYTVNSGMNVPRNYNEGVVSNTIIDSDCHNTAMILHTAGIKPGASGSGLFNWRGQLVGINTIAFGNLSEAVDTLAVRHFLEQSTQYLTLSHN